MSEPQPSAPLPRGDSSSGARVAIISGVVLGVLLLVAAAVGVTLLVVGSDSSSSPNANTAPLPSAVPQVKNATAQYLAGPGSIVTQFRTATAPLRSLVTSSPVASRLPTCQHVADALATVDPSALYDVASQIPDATLAELALDERSAVSSVLVACGKGEQPAMDDALTTLDKVETLIERRLKQVGV